MYILGKIYKIYLQPSKVTFITTKMYSMCLGRLKKKTIDQKKAMENDLKRTINKTVDEMNERINNTKTQM